MALPRLLRNKKLLLSCCVAAMLLLLVENMTISTWRKRLVFTERHATSVPDIGSATVTATTGSDVFVTSVTEANTTVHAQSSQAVLQLCPENPPSPAETKVPLNLTNATVEELNQTFGNLLQNGGRYAPSLCKSLQRIALIIPFRDRERNLPIFLNNVIPFLIKQQTDFTIFLVEQTKDFFFNRCLLFNAGYNETKGDNFTCFILHDVDLIPLDYRNLYRCGSQPRHLMLSRHNENWEEKLPYPSFIGGAIALTQQHIQDSNGCSNWYYGWGLEDDDLEIRLKHHGHKVIRYPMEIGGYYSLTHSPQEHQDKPRIKLRQTIVNRMNQEGLNTLNYTLVSRTSHPLYTHLLIRPPPPPADIYNTR